MRYVRWGSVKAEWTYGSGRFMGLLSVTSM